MQILEQLAYGDEYVNEVALFPNARAKKIWFSKTCNEGKDIINDANACFKSGNYSKAKQQYTKAKTIFTDVKNEVSKLDDGGGIAADLVTYGGTAAMATNFTTLPLSFLIMIWMICSNFLIMTQVSNVLKLSGEEVDIMASKTKNYNIDQPTYVRYFLTVCDDIIYYCDEMAKKCSSKRK